MPTILTHTAVPLAIGLGLGPLAVPRRLLIAGMLAAIAPDLDVASFRFGVAYSAIEGHRGLMHSFVFALMLALLAGVMAASLRTTRTRAFAFVLISGASHGLLDMLTTGGLGVAYLWPFSDARLFFPWHTIEVSPLSMHRLLSPRGRAVMESEWHTVWLPASAICMAVWAVRRVFSRKSAELRQA